ncbi:MAG: LysM peptidoglycan-binding domain-containing protein [Chloroflexi bacterium]|nr:LysM peptidoglycan-binding domain-containing protein [Chloroflexota bacterium]
MFAQRRFILLVAVLWGVSWLVTACVRPVPDESGGAAATAVAGPDLTDPDVGGGILGDTSPAAPTLAPAYPVNVPSPTPEAAQSTDETAVAPTEPSPTPSPAPTTPPVEAISPTATAVPIEAAPPATSAPPVTAGERTHVVQPGENLFRIGLQYGVSWVTLVQFNGLSNPNDIKAGQTLRIPPPGAQPPAPTPTSPANITYYTVQPGDNLYRIGVKFGISWVQIAEANGLANPNQIVVGQTLKIPVNAPGPTPEFTHVVRQGETIFGIAVQYGVAWTSIAEMNNIQSPYVIFAGQTLIIPGS